MIGHLAARLTRKSRSNFYYAFLALPKPRRDALYAVYAFCRTVDDIADLGDERGTDRAEQRRALDRWRADVALCYEPSGAPTDPIAARLAQAVQAFAIPREALLAIIDGVAMDLDRVRYESLAKIAIFLPVPISAVADRRPGPLFGGEPSAAAVDGGPHAARPPGEPPEPNRAAAQQRNAIATLRPVGTVMRSPKTWKRRASISASSAK